MGEGGEISPVLLCVKVPYLWQRLPLRGGLGVAGRQAAGPLHFAEVAGDSSSWDSEAAVRHTTGVCS